MYGRSRSGCQWIFSLGYSLRGLRGLAPSVFRAPGAGVWRNISGGPGARSRGKVPSEVPGEVPGDWERFGKKLRGSRQLAGRSEVMSDGRESHAATVSQTLDGPWIPQGQGPGVGATLVGRHPEETPDGTFCILHHLHPPSTGIFMASPGHPHFPSPSLGYPHLLDTHDISWTPRHLFLDTHISRSRHIPATSPNVLRGLPAGIRQGFGALFPRSPR
jgi:hypothetical protein